MDYDTDIMSAPLDLDADRGDLDYNEYITLSGLVFIACNSILYNLY